MAIVTLSQAKSHLREDSNDRDADITLKLAAAEAAVREYITEDEDDWGTAGPPATVQAAVLLMLGDLDANRGDQEQAQGPADGYLPKAVTNLLYRHRDPSMA